VEVAEVYKNLMSGAKSSRPALNPIMADAKAKRFDCLLVWKLDALGGP
jgi:DNA invertase Pin-like site-specific DNA recombinase